MRHTLALIATRSGSLLDSLVALMTTMHQLLPGGIWCQEPARRQADRVSRGEETSTGECACLLWYRQIAESRPPEAKPCISVAFIERYL
jgi:hypothetical protein